jgi:hypothetical protein
MADHIGAEPVVGRVEGMLRIRLIWIDLYCPEDSVEKLQKS